jgi:methylenetetrahydrofolate reductase (NADPH)
MSPETLDNRLVVETGQSAPDHWRTVFSHASIEISPHEVAQAAAIARWLAPGTEAFLPWLPQSTPDQIVRDATALRSHGLNPVPHVAARRLRSEAECRNLFERLVAEAGVDSVLVIGGDLAQAAGPYDSALALLRTGMAESVGIHRIGISGYPEGHPDIDEETLKTHLDSKLELLRSRNLSPFIVSQFCFDAAAILKWLATLRARGIAEPVRIGLAGPTPLRKLIAMSLRCGVGASLRVLKGKSGMVSGLLSTHGPDALIGDIACGLVALGGTQSTGLHLFAFGGAEETARWLSR